MEVGRTAETDGLHMHCSLVEPGLFAHLCKSDDCVPGVELQSVQSNSECISVHVVVYGLMMMMEQQAELGMADFDFDFDF